MRPNAILLAVSAALLPLVTGCPSPAEKDASKTNETNEGIDFDGVTLSITDASGTLTADLSPLQNDADSDPGNELQTLSFDSGLRELSIGGGNTVTIPETDAQTISFNGGTRVLTISGGNTATIPDSDAQTLSFSTGTRELTIAGGNIVSIPDADAQTLTFDNPTRKLTIGGGNFVTIPDADTDAQTLTFSNGTRELSISAGNLVTIPDADTDAQTLALAAGILSITGGNTVTLPGLVRTRIVSPTPGNDIASGASILAALATLLPAPSATNPWLLRLEPGIYDLGAGTIGLPAFVTLQGSGREATVVKGTGGPSPLITLTGAATLRNLAVTKTGGSTVAVIEAGAPGAGARIEGVQVVFNINNAVGILIQSAGATVTDCVVAAQISGNGNTMLGVEVDGPGSLALRNTDVVVDASASTNAIAFGVATASAALRMEGGSVTITAGTNTGAAGLYASNPGAAATFIGVDVSVEGAPSTALIAVGSDIIEVRSSRIVATSTALDNSGAAGIFVSHSILGGAVAGATNVCGFTLGDTLQPLQADCTP